MKPRAIGVIREEVYKIEVDPDKALADLERHKYPRQRPLTQTTVEQYAQAMKEGTFFHGSQIHIAYLPDGSSYMINGQHRYWAVVESGITMRFSLLESYCRTMEDIDALYYKEDANKRRGVVDLIRATGMAEKTELPTDYLSRVASAAKCINTGFRDSGGKAHDPDNLKASIDEWLQPAKLYYNITLKAGKGIRHRMYRTAILSVALVTMRDSEAKATEFWRGICEDDGLHRGDPRKTFLDFFFNAERRSRNLLRNAYLSRAVASAWNAFYGNQTLQFITVMGDLLDKPINLLGTSYKRKAQKAKPEESKESKPAVKLVKKSKTA